MISGQKKILVMCFTNPMQDMRFKREIDFLKQNYDVTVAGAAPGYPGLPFEEIKCRKESALDRQLFRLGLLAGSFAPLLKRYSVSKIFLQKAKFDLVLCNDLLPLPLAFKIAKGGPVFFDAHEYYPEELSAMTIGQRCSNRAAYRLCRNLLLKISGMSSVCSAICKRYQTEFNLPEEPILLRNIPFYSSLSPSKVLPEKIRMIHHGGTNQDRKLELMIDTLDLLDDRFTLDMMLVHNESDQKYYNFLKARAIHNPRIRILSPVPNKDLITTINHYDLGFYLLPPCDYNTKVALPNKFFEFIQARLGIAIGPSPEMAKIVREQCLGVISDEFTPESMARALQRLTENDIIRFKLNADKIAHEFCAENEMPRLASSIHKIISSGDCCEN